MSDPDDTPQRSGLSWLKAIGLLVLLIIALAIVGHWYWGRRDVRSLEAQIAALRARGEPVYAEDLVEPPIPDEQNAALLLQQAAQSIDTKSAVWVAADELSGTRWGQFDLADVRQKPHVLRAVLEANPQAIPLVEQAMRRRTVRWPIDYQQPIMTLMLPDLSEQRHLAKLLQFAAVDAHLVGDDARAIEHVEQILYVGEALGSQPGLVGYLVSFGIRGLGFKTLSQIAPELKVSSGDPHAVAPERLKELIDRLLDHSNSQRTMAHGFRSERVFQQETLRSLRRGELSIAQMSAAAPPPPGGAAPSRGSAIASYLMRPMMAGDALLLLGFMNQAIEATAAPDWPSFERRLPEPTPAQLNQRPVWRHPFANMLLPSMHRAAKVRYTVDNQAHLAATALAIRWYALEHDGALPATLDELVPHYLPRVPQDLMTASDSIRYIDDPERPRLYHVGENGKDDGGREPDSTAPSPDRDADEVVHLKPQPLTTTQKVD